MDDDQRFDLIAERRRSLAGFLRDLPEERWRVPSLCSGWTVRQVAGHLATPFLIGTARFAWEMVRCGGSFDRAADRVARRLAEMPTDELVAVIEEHATDRYTPPGLGPIAPLTDSVVHTLDVRWSLDARDAIPPDAAREVLGFLSSRSARSRAFGARAVAPDVCWSATDLDWSTGPADSPVVSGPADAVLLVLAGRRAGLDDLQGPGLGSVKARLAR
ncbi:MAG: hypothetical protein JWM05_2705 [Acidimicrobiales bacterium]|nr:hypothetical protein [Acidimicrobiales bacterium]